MTTEPTNVVEVVSTRAGDVIASGCHCSEAVLIAVGSHYAGTLPPEVVRISCPFGGGVGGCREEICGALSGAVMVMGLLWGREECSEDDKPLYELVKELRTRFSEELGETICNPIRERYAEQPGKCRPVVEVAARIVTEIIERERPTRPFKQ